MSADVVSVRTDANAEDLLNSIQLLADLLADRMLPGYATIMVAGRATVVAIRVNDPLSLALFKEGAYQEAIGVAPC